MFTADQEIAVRMQISVIISNTFRLPASYNFNTTSAAS